MKNFLFHPHKGVLMRLYEAPDLGDKSKILITLILLKSPLFSWRTKRTNARILRAESDRLCDFFRCLQAAALRHTR